MNEIHAMRVFVRVADTESFHSTARQLRVSNALISRAIASLEARLKTRLINRTTRRVSLTEAGARYLEGCRTFLEELDHLGSTIARTEDELSGALRVVASTAVSQFTLTQLVDGFRKLHPSVTVRLTLAERHVHFVENGFDVGIVTGLADDTAVVKRTVGVNAFVPVATPAFLREHGLPAAPGELRRLSSVGLQEEMRSQTWNFRSRHSIVDEVTLAPAYSVDNWFLARLATLHSIGFSILPRGVVQTDLDDGILVRLLPDYSIDEPDKHIFIAYPVRQHLPRKTCAFIEYALDYLSRELAVSNRRTEDIDTLALQQPQSLPDAISVAANAI
ncbi:LysR family transcriptional regulator [Caballeronia sp. S22]|uniref:LysR family transcriptional regulator n=1 Tax=Caballeronia sp. S22 TaxID=3137182 RepID=UPI00353153C1